MGRDEPLQDPPRHNVPADLLQICPGYLGPSPETDGQLSDALIAAVRAQICANTKIQSINTILNKGPR